MKGRTFTTAVVASLLVITSIAAPAIAADGDQIRHGADAIPSWHVHVEAGEVDTLEEWATSADSREILQKHNESGYALIQAPNAAAGKTFAAGLLNNGLSGKSYVVDIRPNLQHSLADPVRLQNSSLIPDPSTFDQLRASIGTAGIASWSSSGIAHAEDANQSTPADVRNVLGVDNVSATGDGATIAVIDSGVNTADGAVFGNGTFGSQPRLLDASKDFVDNETVADVGLDAVEDPGTNHGTWVASAATANHSNDAFDGIAPNADILALRALDAQGSGSSADISAAIRYAADQNADAIVMSLGSPVYDAELSDALQYAQDENVSALPVAAGNSRQTTRWLASPADAPVDGVAAISATNTTSNSTAGSAYFANVGADIGADGSFGATAGEDVTVSSPGMNVMAKTPGTDGSVSNSTLSGTSMSAPDIVGIAALGVETNEPWVGNASEFADRLRATARPIPNAATVEVGGGMAAADRLLNNETGSSQTGAMTDAAQTRDEFWLGLGEWGTTFNFDSLRQVIP